MYFWGEGWWGGGFNICLQNGKTNNQDTIWFVIYYEPSFRQSRLIQLGGIFILIIVIEHIHINTVIQKALSTLFRHVNFRITSVSVDCCYVIAVRVSGNNYL